MSYILTVQAQLQCPHGGVASAASLRGSRKLTIAGQNVLCEDNIGAVPFSCPALTKCTGVNGWQVRQGHSTVNCLRILHKDCLPITNCGIGKVVSTGQTSFSSR